MTGPGPDNDGNEKPRSIQDDISRRFSQLLHSLGINGRNGLGFYTLRRTFEIQAGESKDQVAVDAIMGRNNGCGELAGCQRGQTLDGRVGQTMAASASCSGVTVPLRREFMQDPQKRLADDCQSLAVQNNLEAEFEIPNAASRIKFSADFKRRTVSCAMRLKAPEDRVRAKARINWMFNQLKHVPDDNLLIKVTWPFRTPDTFATLGVLKTNPDAALSDKTTAPPSAFDVIMTRDLMARFKGAQTFVQDTQGFILEFYEKVGQHLREWVAPPPKVSISDPSKVIDGTVETQPDDIAVQPVEPVHPPEEVDLSLVSETTSPAPESIPTIIDESQVVEG